MVSVISHRHLNAKTFEGFRVCQRALEEVAPLSGSPPMHICAYVLYVLYACMHVCIYVSMYVLMYIIYIYMCVCVCVYVWMYECISVCKYASMYVTFSKWVAWQHDWGRGNLEQLHYACFCSYSWLLAEDWRNSHKSSNLHIEIWQYLTMYLKKNLILLKELPIIHTHIGGRVNTGITAPAAAVAKPVLGPTSSKAFEISVSRPCLVESVPNTSSEVWYNWPILSKHIYVYILHW